MLPIHHLVVKNVKKFVVFNLCLLLSVITLCNISVLKCFADDSDERASESSRASYSIENITECNTEPNSEKVSETFEATEETTKTFDGEEASEFFYYRFIVVLLIIILFLIIVSKLL